MLFKLHIGMRKIKSLLSVSFSFLIWQLIRLFLPMLESHPVFAYIYSIIEMRESPDKTKKFGRLRIKATFVGLIVGLIFITFSVLFVSKLTSEALRIFIEFVFILIATLCSLCIAEIVKCQNFCGIAAIITVISMVSHNEDDIYLYAIMRVVQTLLGVFSATLINTFIKKSNTEETEQNDNNIKQN